METEIWRSSFLGRIVAQEVSKLLPNSVVWVRSQSGYVGFALNKIALGQVFSQYLGFLCQFSFHQMFDTDSVVKQRI
jgi:hypothetical protein